MSLYLLDMDKLAIDLRKESVLKHFNKQDRIKIGNLCNNLIRYNKNGKPELNSILLLEKPIPELLISYIIIHTKLSTTTCKKRSFFFFYINCCYVIVIRQRPV